MFWGAVVAGRPATGEQQLTREYELGTETVNIPIEMQNLSSVPSSRICGRILRAKTLRFAKAFSGSSRISATSFNSLGLWIDEVVLMSASITRMFIPCHGYFRTKLLGAWQIQWKTSSATPFYGESEYSAEDSY